MKRLFVAIIFTLAGCASKPSESQLTNQINPNTTNNIVAGYYHSVANSKAAIGTLQNNDVLTSSEANAVRTIGKFGVFSVHQHTGFALAVLNNDAPALSRPPYSEDAEVHNQHAKEYFLAAGIPADQIKHVVAHATVTTGGPTNVDSNTWERHLQSYTSILARQIDGVPVGESLAFVSFNIDGDVTSEGVHWPSINVYIVSEAKSFQAKFKANPESYFSNANVPMNYRGGEVQIRHSHAVDPGEFRSYAVYSAFPDAMHGDPMGKERHWDSNGNEVKFEYETRPAPVRPGLQRPKRSGIADAGSGIVSGGGSR